MNKGKIYTFLVFCLSFAVVFGGWFLTKEMLNRKEAKIFAEKGKISMESSKTNAKETESQNALSEQEEFEGVVLSEEAIYQILSIWERGGREIPHEPELGQMNMEQAIEAGRDWIITLAENNRLPAKLVTGNFDKTNAILYTLENYDESIGQIDEDSLSMYNGSTEEIEDDAAIYDAGTEQIEVDNAEEGTETRTDSEIETEEDQEPLEETLISYWQITYVKDDIKIILTIHAASGQVWSAEISGDADSMIFELDITDQEMCAMAFPFLTEQSTSVIVENGNVYKYFAGGIVLIRLKMDEIIENEQETLMRWQLGLCTANFIGK